MVVIVYINVDDTEEQMELKEPMSLYSKRHWEQADWKLALSQQHSEELRAVHLCQLQFDNVSDVGLKYTLFNYFLHTFMLCFKDN